MACLANYHICCPKHRVPACLLVRQMRLLQKVAMGEQVPLAAVVRGSLADGPPREVTPGEIAQLSHLKTCPICFKADTARSWPGKVRAWLTDVGQLYKASFGTLAEKEPGQSDKDDKADTGATTADTAMADAETGKDEYETSLPAL